MNVPPRQLEPRAARNYLLANLLVLPGLGTWLAGQRVAGGLQMLLATTGFGLTAWWFCRFCLACWQTKSLPLDGGPGFVWGCMGLGLFVAGWVWSLVSALRLR